MSQALARELRAVAERAWDGGFTVMSDFAQRNMVFVAMAASQHLITTQMDKTKYGRRWRITGKGLRWLNETKEHNT